MSVLATSTGRAAGTVIRRFASDAAPVLQGAAQSTGHAGRKVKRSILRRVITGVAGGVAAGAGGLVLLAQYDEGTKRSLTFWGQAFPIYAHYRAVQSYVSIFSIPEDEADAMYEKLHNQHAGKAEALTLQLKGMYLKNAQLVSTRDEFLPPQYMKFCKRMQDEVPSEYGEGMIEKVIEEELGRPMEDVFEWFDPNAYGAASIGEVHRARLKSPDGTSPGRDVVVKVQYPNIEQKFRGDLKTMLSFSELAMPQHVAPLKEIEKQFMTEFDYRGEAENLQTVANNVMPVWGDKVYIPLPHMELCTKRVMVMDFVPGVRLVDGVNTMFRDYAESKGMTLEELEEEQKEKIRSGEVQRRDIKDEARRGKMISAMISAKDVAQNSGRFLYNWTVGWVSNPVEYEWTSKPLNLGEILDTLNKVHAHEIFVDGAFNGDPHPGNVLLLPDGRLGLIDYGQVKHLTLEQRIEYAKFVVALAKGTKKDVVDQFRRMGYRSKKMDFDVTWRLAAFWNDRDDEPVTGGRNVQTFMDYCEATDPMETVPQDYVMASRVSVMMRGMGNAFGLKLRTAPSWLPLAEELLRDNMIDPLDAVPDAVAKGVVTKAP